MNKHLYRIVFNERRGQLMVVGDNVLSSGKAASGEGGAAAPSGGRAQLRTQVRSSCLNLYVAFGVLVGMTAPTHAQIVADPNAPGSQRATVLQTSNGVVQVNIQTPSAAGVSRNVYSQFDVTAQGAVLNNSRTNVQTQIGGWVQGNPWLAGGGARVILNEVNSNNPSSLNGYVEVAGQRAELVIANPSGVNVDGGGFINASRVTITTGTPRVNGGSLDSYLVERGAVTINGRGMDAAEADYVGILARAIQVNAGIWAKEIRVVGGVNQIDASQASTTAQAGAGVAPAFALDVAYLGGMYAGKIMLIGTEAGVGMRNAGTIAASAGDLVLESSGWLRNSGSMQATAGGSNTQLTVAGDTDNTGTVYAGGDTRVVSGGDVVNSGLIAAQNDSAVLANGSASRIDVGAGGIFASGLKGDGTFGSSGNARMAATKEISFRGLGTAAGNVELHSAQIDLSGARLSGIDLALQATSGNVNASGAHINARGALAFTATGAVRTDAAQVEANSLSVSARDLFNVGGKISQLGFSDLAIALPGALDNTAGRIGANSGSLAVGAGNLINADGTIEHAGTGTFSITAGSLSGARGKITGNGSVNITTGQFDHHGASTSGLEVAISAAHLDNSGGSVSAIGNTVLAAGGLNNSNGVVATGADLTVTASDVDNSRGVLQAQAGDITLRVASLNNTAGSVNAAGGLDTTAIYVDNSGSLYAGHDQRLSVSGAVANSGVIAAQGHTTVSANSLDSTSASLLGAGVRADGALAHTGDLQITTAANLAASGQNLAAGHVTLAGASVDVSGSQTAATGIALLASSGNVSTSGATVVAADTLAVTAGNEGQALVNTQGTLSAGHLDVQVANLDNTQGTIIQSGAGDTRIVLTSATGLLDNIDGRIAVNSANLTLGGATLTNTGGRIEHSGTGALSITAARLDGQRGQITGNGSVLITANDFDHNRASTSGRTVGIYADSLSNLGGHLLQSGAGELTLQVAHRLDNAGGEIAADGGLCVQAGAIDNSGGRFTSAVSAEVGSTGVLNNSNGVVAAAHALMVAGQAMDNTGGALQAGSDALTLSAASLLNNDGVVSAGTDLTARVAGELNNGGVMYAGRDQTLDVGGAFINAGSVAALGNVAIAAGSVDSGPGALLGAGINSQGSLAQSGTLTVNAAYDLRAAGQNLAAGDMLFRGASVDLNGSDSDAANIAIAADGGDVMARNASVNTVGRLSVMANTVAGQKLDTKNGTLSAGQLALNVANLNNDHGTLIQSGRGNTEITLSNPDGTLDNTSGRIATNASNLTLGAGLLVNTDGKIEHAGDGTLSINAAALSGRRGKIIGNGSLVIAAGEVDHRSANIVAQQVTITAANLDNWSGQIAQLGAGNATLTTSGNIGNSGGRIESNGDATISAAKLENAGGRIGAMGSMTVAASTGLDNRDGLVAAGADITVLSGDVDNSRGLLQALAGNAILRVGGLNNQAGSVYTGGDLDAMARHVDNSGSLYAAGDQRLSVSGAIDNSGVIAAQGHTTITAHSLDGTAVGLLGAGIKADGTLTQTRDLTVTTATNLASSGQNLAAGHVTLAGASVDVSGSQTGATGIALLASSGNVSTSGATIVATDRLAVSARNDGQALVNTHGTLSAGQLDAQVANLDNTRGTIILSGSGETRIVLTSAAGRLDNIDGRIAVNSADLTLGAATLTNTGGRIEHAGTGALSITAARLDGQRGQITGNGSVLITASEFDHNGASTSGRAVGVHAASMSNLGGHLVQSGAGELTLQVAHQLDNAGGEIAADGGLQVQAGAIENSGGRFTSAVSAQVSSTGLLNNSDGVVAAALELTVAGQAIDNTGGAIQAGNDALTLSAASLLNNDGVVSAGTDLTAGIAGELSNSGVMYAGRDHTLDVRGAFINAGSVAALGNVAITAGSVESGPGALLGAGIDSAGSLAPSGTLTVTAAGVLRATGQNLAAGDMLLSGASVDLNGSESGAANIAITATGGNVSTGHASVNTAGTLSVTANAVGTQILDNGYGTLSAGQLALRVANLNNDHGTLIQSGSGNTDITLSEPDGTLDNTSGRIATNASNLTLGAGLLVNTDGKIEHAGAGTLTINAATLSGQRGQIIGNGALAISAGAVDHRGASTTAQHVTVASASLDNRSGQIAQLGAGNTTITASGNIDNSAGSIESNGNAVIGAATLANIAGRIGAMGSVAFSASGGLDNRDGLVATGADLTVLAGDIDNSRGVLQAQAGDVTLRLNGLNNVAGSVFAGGNLDAAASHVENSGSLYAVGDQRLAVNGAIANSGVIAAQGSTTIMANSIVSTEVGLLAAGVKGDGALAQAGDLTITAAGNLSAHGQNLAAGQATLVGVSVDVSGSRTGAAGIALFANGGNVSTRGASVVAAGTLAVAARHYGQSLVNTRGTLSAGQLDLQVANLDNTQGTIIQSGVGDTQVVLTSADGRFDNTDGRIAVNSANLTLAAATLANTDGRIEHAGDGALDITAANLEGQRGEITGNGSLLITADHIDHRAGSIVAERLTIAALSLDNREGSITQLGSGQGAIDASGTLDNRSGRISTNGDATITGGTLYNQSGIVQASGAASLNLAIDGVVDNRDAGSIAAGTNATLRAGSILNQLGQIGAGATLSTEVSQEIRNEGGRLVAGEDVRMIAASLQNTGGIIAAVLGNASAITGGAIVNDSGVIQAAGDIVLQSGGLSNTQALGHAASGSIVGRNVEIETNGHALNNQLGTIASAEALDVSSGALFNDAGLLQAGTALSIDTGGRTLSNTNAAGYGLMNPGSTGGIVSEGAIALNVGDWYNAGGFFGAGGTVRGSTAMINNALLNGTGGQIVGQSTLDLGIAGLRNQGGQIQVLGDITLNAGDGIIDNRESLIRSGATLTLQAGTIDNRATQGDGRGLEGHDIEVTAALVANNQGAVRADNDATINSGGSIDNTDAMISAGKALNIVDPGAVRNLAIFNTGGTLIGGVETNVHAATLGGDGQVLSLGDLTIDLSGDYVQRATGEITANNNVSIVVAGDLKNFGKLRAGAELAIRAAGIDNTAEGDISAGRTRIDAAGILSNRGLIDGFETQVNAGTLNNTGTGRIYGDYLGIAAGHVNNEAEAGTAATIAARNRLDIGVSTLSNSEHGLIFSSGDMAIGGALNLDRQAIGRADNVTNASATIESLGQLSLSAHQVSNLNNHFSTELVTVESPYTFTEYQGVRSTEYQGINSRFLAGTPGLYTYDDGEFLHLRTPDAVYNEQWSRYDTTRTTQQTVVTGSDPGRIVSGGQLAIDADNVLNINSHILAGGRLSIGAGVLNNTAAEGQKITSDSGTATLYTRIHEKGKDRTGDPAITYYTLPDIIETISLGSSRVEEYTGSTGVAVPGALAVGGVSSTTSAAGSAGVEINTSAIVKVAASVTTGSVANAQGTDSAEGAEGLSSATRPAANSGAMDEVIGERAAELARQESAHSTSSIAVESTAGGVDDKRVDAVLGLGKIGRSNPVGAAGRDGASDTVTGAQANVSVERGGSSGTALAVSRSSLDRTSSYVAVAAVGIESAGHARTGSMMQVTLAHPSDGVQVVRTNAPLISLPNASLYTTNSAETERYLVVTDARFANYQQWLGSDYMLDQLQLDPSVTQKRLGDGYYEQSLIRAQVAQLTGQRYLAGYANDDEEYRALMNAGVAVAKTLNLRPGVALSAAQMAALTDDIVWMVEKEVTLADGSVQKVLVPQVYARVREGDLDGGGALLAGRDTDIRVSGELVNSGTIGGRDTARLTADNVQNLGGRIHSDVVSVAARNDLNNTGGTISANSGLIATAGRDINIETTTRSGTSSAGTNSFARTSLDRVAGLYVTGDGSNGSGTLVAEAGRDVNLIAGQIGNAGKDGATTVTAGRNLNLTTVGTASSNSISWDAKNYHKDSSTTEVGSQIQASGAITLKAGADINARAADVQAGKSLTVAAGNDINIVSGVSTIKLDEGHESTHKGFLSRKTITTRDTIDRSSALGTSLGGDTVSLVAGNDIKVIGSAITGDGVVSLVAAKALTVSAATDTSSESHHLSVKQSGFLSGGGFGFSYGTRTITTDQQQDASIQSGQARSIVGSTGGSVNLVAGTSINVAGSDLAAAQDITLAGRSVAITPGQDQVNGKFVSKMTQDGLTLAIGGSVVNAIGTIQGMSAAAGQTKNTRVKALAAATAAMAAKNAASDIAANGLSISLSLTAGHSESEQTQTTSSTSHFGSALSAGNNIAISATGGGTDSNVAIVGSDVGAKHSISLRADNQVNLLAAQDLESQHSESKSMSAAAGIAATYSSKGGPAAGITGSVSASRATMDGEGVTQVNSYIDAGAQLSIASGGDTNLKGAIASAAQVIGDVKGNLNIASLQDTATFDSKEQSASVSGTYGYGATVSASFNQSKIRSDYASVQERSGIQSGDGGFEIKVGGNTDLKGGIIGSTDAGSAVSSLTTATLTHSDIANHATMKASSMGVAGSATASGGESSGKGQGPGGTNLMNMRGTGTGGGVSGMANTSDSATSSTGSAISASTLVITDDAAQRAATGKGAEESVAGISKDTTGGRDKSGGIANTFNPNEAQAVLTVTAAFAASASKAVGDYAGDKLKEANGLRIEEHNETDPEKKAELARSAAALEDHWKEGGSARAALHAVVGGLVGGTDGALGAGVTALATPAIADRIAQLDVPDIVKNAFTLGAGAAVGSAVGGETGAIAAFNEVENNYLKHKELITLREQLTSCEKRSCSEPERQAIIDYYVKVSASNDASLAACVTRECVDGHAKEIAAAGQIQHAVLGAIDGRGGNELRGRQVKTAAITHQYKKIDAANRAAGELRLWAINNCKGISLQECGNKLKEEKKFVSGLIVDFAPVVGDIKGFADAETSTDYLFAALGVVAGPLGDAFKALNKVEKIAPTIVVPATARAAVDAVLDRKVVEEVISNNQAITGYGNKVADEIASLSKLAKNNGGVIPGPGERGLTRSEYDSLISKYRNSGAALQNDLDNALLSQGYVYRATTLDTVDIYRANGFVAGRSGGTFMSTDYVGLDVATLMDRGQVFSQWGVPEVLLKIPTSELSSATVPRPLGGKLSVGWEPRTLFYPKAGSGGQNQFLGITKSWDDSWVIPLIKKGP